MSTQTPHFYRPEIDGLRSIAVLSVVLYHFGFAGLQGGFVGVDVFFVISGFLIGGLLWREASETGSISLKRFYVRRIKRLAPAYVAMALASLIAAYFIVLPFEFREFGKSLIAATVYLSNVSFFREAGYFDTVSEDKVLLHTWSLSVEEQFYIILPLLMLLLLRNTFSLRIVLWISLVVSLIACAWITQRSQPAAFYLFPFRAWELLAGVILAIEVQRRPFKHVAFLSYLGLTLILASIAFIPAGAQFPGWHALFPVLGTVLIIANGQQKNIVNRTLASPAPVAIGLISYSLYLWHWPVLTLSTYYRGAYSGHLETTFWLGISIALAYLSWRFVERPVRRTDFSALLTFTAAALASAVLVLAGGLIYLKDGMIERFEPPLRTHIEASADFLQDWSRCYVSTDGPFLGLELCPIGPEQAPEILIWGDSHVRALKEGLEQAAFDADTPALLIWRAGCAPVFGLVKNETSASPVQNEACSNANAQIETALQAGDFKRVLLVGRWGYYAQGSGTGLDAGNQVALSVEGTTGSQAEQFSQGLIGTVQRIQGFGSEVFVLKAIPEIRDYDSRHIARALAGNRLSDESLATAVEIPAAAHEKRVSDLSQTLAQIDANGAALLDPAPFLCAAQTCSALHDGKAQYFDNNHIINSAALRIRSLFDPLFASESNP